MMMRRLFFTLSACLLLAAWTNPAGASLRVITFEDIPTEPFDMLTKDGVLFTAFEGDQLQRGFPEPGKVGITTTLVDGVFPPVRADLPIGATFVSIDIGRSTWGNQTVFLEAFDASDNKLGEDVAVLVAGTGVIPLSFTALPSDVISWVRFGDVDGDGVATTRFAYVPIPAPGAVLLGAIGVGLVGHLRRRKTL
jgi:hypothetical protein